MSAVARIRQAQRLRGQTVKGFKSWKRVAIPLLEEALAKSLDLAESMDSRGYGVSRKRSKYRPIKWRPIDFLVMGSAVIVLGLS